MQIKLKKIAFAVYLGRNPLLFNCKPMVWMKESEGIILTVGVFHQISHFPLKVNCITCNHAVENVEIQMKSSRLYWFICSQQISRTLTVMSPIINCLLHIKCTEGIHSLLAVFLHWDKGHTCDVLSWFAQVELLWGLSGFLIRRTWGSNRKVPFNLFICSRTKALCRTDNMPGDKPHIYSPPPVYLCCAGLLFALIQGVFKVVYWRPGGERAPVMSTTL